jgi:hypothetical protein
MTSETTTDAKSSVPNTFRNFSTLQYILLGLNVISLLICWQKDITPYNPNSWLDWQETKFLGMAWLAYPIGAYYVQAFQIKAYREAGTPSLPFWQKASVLLPCVVSALSHIPIIIICGRVFPSIGILSFFAFFQVLQINATLVAMKKPTAYRVVLYYLPTTLISALTPIGTAFFTFLMRCC